MNLWQRFASIPNHFFSNTWLQTQQRSILSAAAVITGANLLVSISGLLRDRLMLGHFAKSEELLQAYDAFRISFQIPDLLFQLLIVGALSASFVPIFSLFKKKSRAEGFKFVNICLNYLLLFFIIGGILIMIFAPQITHWRIGEAYNEAQIQIVIELTRIMLLGQLFFAISSFFSGMLQSYQRFIVPSLVPLLYNGGIVLGTYLLFPILGIKAAGAGVIIGAFLHMAVQFPFVKRLGWKYKWTWDFNFPLVKKLFSLMPARTLTLGMNEVQNFGLSYFATSIPGVIAGGVSGIGYTLAVLARALIVMPIRFVGVPIGQASLPFLADLSDEANLTRFKKIVLQSLSQIAYLACPAAVLLLILRIPAVRLVFGTRDFAWELTVMVGQMVAIMALSIPMQAMFHLLLRGFHALRDTVTPFLISLFTTCVFFIGAALAVQMPKDQLLGIAVTICVTGVLEGVLYIAFLHFKLKKLITLSFIITQMKIVLSSGVMAIGLYLPFKLLDNFVFNTSRVVPLLALTLITSVLGLSVYIGLSKIFKIQEMEILINFFRYFKKKEKSETKLLLPPTEIINEGDENKV